MSFLYYPLNTLSAELSTKLMNRGKQCGPRSDCSNTKQSDLGLHSLHYRLFNTFNDEQMTSVAVGALSVNRFNSCISY